MSSVTIKGTYGSGPAAVVVHRHPPAQMVQIQCSHPSVLLDAAGHHELLEALANPGARHEPRSMPLNRVLDASAT